MEFPDEIRLNVGRCEIGDRQEGVGKLSIELFPGLHRIHKYAHAGLSRDPNILRDSCAVRLQALPLLAGIHLEAIYYFKVLEELRARTNTIRQGGRTAGPLAVAALNDELWALGEALQSDDKATVLRILEHDFRPFTPDAGMDKWWEHRMERTVLSVSGASEINEYSARCDAIFGFQKDSWEKYEPILLHLLRLLGEGIHESLERSCSRQLSRFNGEYSVAMAEDWVREKDPHLLVVNDGCESSFAKVASTLTPLTYPYVHLSLSFVLCR